MGQFDILRNPGRQRDTIPYVIVLQNDRFDQAATRFVAPLVLASRIGVREHWLAPRFIVDGVEVVMDVFNLATLPVERLGRPVGTLAGEDTRTRLMRAIDELVSQA